MDLLRIAARVAVEPTAVPVVGGAMGPFLQIDCHACGEHSTVKETSCQSCGDEIWFDQSGSTLPADVVCPKCKEQQTVDSVICPSCGKLTAGSPPEEEDGDPGPPSDPGPPWDTLEEKRGEK